MQLRPPVYPSLIQRPAAILVDRIRSVFAGLPDKRGRSNNQQYAIQDAAMSAFSVFFTQSPSFLDYQIRMQKQQGKNNAQSLFGVYQIPCDNQVRNLLDPVPPDTLFPLMASIGDDLYRNGYLDAFRSVGNTLLIVFDGTEFFSSEKISCPCCSRADLKNGKTRYHHSAVTPVLVAPGQQNIVPLPPEFVQPQDGQVKQDCEINAGGRWLSQWGSHYAIWGITFLGDDLYCHQPFCQQVLDSKAHYLFTCKPGSHSLLYEWIADFTRNNAIASVVCTRWTGKKRLTDTYRYINQVPLRDGDDALMVNWCELTTTTDDGAVIYHSAWATSHLINNHNIQGLVEAARARWKIENEGNNTLKTKGYHFEHNFGHGKQHLANLFATMILLAYLVHTTLDWRDERYRMIRRLLPSRRTFFEHLRTLLQYFPFDDWDHLMGFMLKGLDAPDTG
jgi:hypothetical protein